MAPYYGGYDPRAQLPLLAESLAKQQLQNRRPLEMRPSISYDPQVAGGYSGQIEGHSAGPQFASLLGNLAKSIGPQILAGREAKRKQDAATQWGNIVNQSKREMGPYAPPETKEEPIYFGETKTVRTGQEPYRLRTPTERLDNVISTGLQSEYPEVREASSKLAVQQLLKQPDKTTRLLTTQEKIAAGYNEKSVVQIEPDGTHNVVKKYEQAPLESKTFYSIGSDGQVDMNSVVSVPYRAGERNEEYRAQVNNPNTIEGKPPSPLIVHEADPVPTPQEEANAVITAADRSAMTKGPLFDAKENAPIKRLGYAQMRATLEGINWTGTGKQLSSKLASWGRSIGLDLKRIGFDWGDDLTDVEIFNNLRGQATLAVVNSMSGSVSEGEIIFAGDTLGNLGQTKEALETTLEILHNTTIRDEAMYNAKAQWLLENGRVTQKKNKDGLTFNQWVHGYTKKDGEYHAGVFHKKDSGYYSPIIDPVKHLKSYTDPAQLFAEQYETGYGKDGFQDVIEFPLDFFTEEKFPGINPKSKEWKEAQKLAGNTYTINVAKDGKGNVTGYTWQLMMKDLDE